jgi:hypothetical protein
MKQVAKRFSIMKTILCLCLMATWPCLGEPTNGIVKSNKIHPWQYGPYDKNIVRKLSPRTTNAVPAIPRKKWRDSGHVIPE